MAFTSLNSYTLPWQNLGLRYLLLKRDMQIQNITKTQIPAKNNRTNFSEEAKKEVNRKKTTQANSVESQILPVKDWPVSWQDFFASTRKGIFVWTYWNLGRDIKPVNEESDQQKQLRKARGNLLRTLISDLAHPAGTHTFFPSALYESRELKTNHEVFWSALSILECRGVLIFGSTAARALLPDTKLAPLTSMRKNNFLVWILWELDSLVTDNDKYKRALIFLRQVFKPFIHPDL